MSALLRASALSGRPVVTLDGAEAVAAVRGVVLARSGPEVLGFSLSRTGLLSAAARQVLPWSRVAAFGPDAVMVADRAALVVPTEQMARDATPDERILGSSVVTEAGRRLGEVADLVLAVQARPVVVGLALRGQAVGSPQVGELLMPCRRARLPPARR